MQEDRGITIELTQDVADELRRNCRPGKRSAVEPKGLVALNAVSVVSEEEDWECLIPVSLKNNDSEVNIIKEEASTDDDGQVVNENELSVDEDDASASTISYTPPSSLPVVLVDVERLTGYTPSSETEAESLIHTVRSALWGEEDLQNGEGSEDEKKKEEERIILARDFEERVAELFQTGLARHSDTSVDLQSMRFMAVDYPEYLCRLDGSLQVLPTSRVWKKLLLPHDIPVVHSLLVDVLSGCSRSLLWKYDMRQEIEVLAASEEDEATRRHHEAAVLHWKSGRRKEQLDKLYTVRDTLDERLQQSRDHQKQLEDERDRAMRNELQKRRLQQCTGGLQAFDFESTLFAFPDADDTNGISTFLGLDDDDYCQKLLCSDDDDYDEERDSDDEILSIESNDDDEDEEFVEETKDVTISSNEGEPITHNANKGRRQAAVRRRRQRLGEAAKEAEHKSKLDAAKAEEERVQELFTTQQLRIAMALTTSLHGKLQHVDALLESLQEEQWADEEAAEDERGTKGKSAIESQYLMSVDDPGLSLLDQILAMILGACPSPEGTSLDAHVRQLEQKHRSIVKEWKEQFGRLPPALSSSGRQKSDELGEWDASSAQQATADVADKTASPESSTLPETLRASLGIVDNEEVNWDDDEGETVEVKRQSISPPKATGLRPGGRL